MKLEKLVGLYIFLTFWPLSYFFMKKDDYK